MLREGLRMLESLQKALEKWKLQKLLSGPYDDRGAILTIQVGLRPPAVAVVLLL